MNTAHIVQERRWVTIPSTEYKHIRNAEQEIAAICPLNCAYCYIPKHGVMKKMHSKIVESIKTGKYIETLKMHYGDNLEGLGLWGTEPTIVLDVFGEHLQEYLEAFPKLKEISFSTSLLTDINTIIRFAERLAKTDRNFTFKIQVSLDGPAFVTDVNRMPGAAKNVPENLVKLLTILKEINHGKVTIKLRWKPTISIENMRLMIENDYLIDSWYGYFTRINRDIKQMKLPKWINFAYNSNSATLVVPGKYTTEDADVFCSWLKKMHEVGYDTSYTWRMKRLHDWSHESHKKFMFTCSGGDANFGIGEDVHICHRTFFIENDEYINAVLETDIDNWDVSNFKRGTLQLIKDKFIVGEEDRERFLYVMRGYHDYWNLGINYNVAMVKELAMTGQADEEYLWDDALCNRFALFIISALGCHMENLLNTGTIHTTPISIIRLWAGGAYQELERRFMECIEKKIIGY